MGRSLIEHAVRHLGAVREIGAKLLELGDALVVTAQIVETLAFPKLGIVGDLAVRESRREIREEFQRFLELVALIAYKGLMVSRNR